MEEERKASRRKEGWTEGKEGKWKEGWTEGKME